MRWAAVGLILALVVAAVVFTLSGPDDAAGPPVAPPQTKDAAGTEPPPPVVPGTDTSAPEPKTGPARPGTGEDEEGEGLLLRFIDSVTGKPVKDLAGLVLSWEKQRKGRRGAVPSEEGWFRLPEIDHAWILELGIPGYSRATLDLRNARGRVELAVDPVPAAAVGSIVGPGGAKAPPLEFSLRPFEVDRLLPEYAVIGIPATTGAFRLYDLPEGRYELEVTSVVSGVCVRAKRTFHHLGGTTEFGEIELVLWAGIRARVVDQDGRVIPQARVVIVREEEDEKRGRVIEPDQKGWVTFRDFEPGAWHRVAASGLPGRLERLVLAPEKREGLETVELTWPGRLVTCVLRFQDGEEILSPPELRDGPIALREEHYTKKWTITVDLLPGEYEWKWGPRDVSIIERKGRFVVPPQRRFESVVQLSLSKRKD